MNDLQAQKSIIEIAHKFLQEGLTLGSWGNISCRVGKTLAITPSGKSYETLQAKDIVIIGKKHPLTPSSELLLHQEIYSARKDINAIVHTHSIYATALACLHEDLPIITEDIAQLANGAKIKCAKYALAGTQELAKNTANALGDGFAVLLANHGAVACGKNLHQALLFAELLEKAAQTYLIDKSARAKIFALPLPKINQIKKFYFECYAKRQEGEKYEI